MRTLVLVVDVGSFSGAARQMGVAPSSVSRKINELEADLGINLFHRTTRTLSLTEAGHVYYERVRRIIEATDETRLALSEMGTPAGILRVTAPTGIGRELIISALPPFLEKYPGIEVVMSMSDNIINIVEAGIDVGIRIGQLQDSSIKARKVGMSRRIVCANPDYLSKAGVPESPMGLVRHNCLTFRDHPGHNLWTFLAPGGKKEVKVTGSFFSRNADALVAAAVAGMGLVMLPEWNVRSELEQKRLVAVLPKFDAVPSSSPIWAVHAHQRHVPSKIRVFIDFLVDHFSNVEAVNRNSKV